MGSSFLESPLIPSYALRSAKRLDGVDDEVPELLDIQMDRHLGMAFLRAGFGAAEVGDGHAQRQVAVDFHIHWATPRRDHSGVDEVRDCARVVHRRGDEVLVLAVGRAEEVHEPTDERGQIGADVLHAALDSGRAQR